MAIENVVTLGREMIEIAKQKFPENRLIPDEVRLPTISPTRTFNTHPRACDSPLIMDASASSDEEDEDYDDHLKAYWSHVRERHFSNVVNASSLATSHVDSLPPHWTLVNIGVTEDRSSMFISRQRAKQKPLVFCLPLKGRRESDDDEHLTFDDALNELKSIIDGSNESTKRAVNVKNDDIAARTQWWDERRSLDNRLKELLQNVEFCWLGAFKVNCLCLTNPGY